MRSSESRDTGNSMILVPLLNPACANGLAANCGCAALVAGQGCLRGGHFAFRMAAMNALPAAPATLDRPPLRPIAFARPDIHCETAPDGTIRLRSRTPLAGYEPSLAGMFRAAVERNPSGLFLAERDAGGSWRKLTYGEARPLVDALAAGLVERGLSPQRPLMILSGNGIDHALLTLAGHTAGVPVAPISVAYSLQSQDHAKLKHIAALLEPGLIYVADTAPFAKSLAALDLSTVEIVASRNGGNL